MKILGLILESNPFHNGHKYFIEESLKLSENKPFDYVIAITSTSFCMRGEISVIDKFTKTKLYLKNNIDLVLELPNYLSINSSDQFCFNAINILSKFKITDLSFGSEIGDIEKLKELSNYLSSPSFNIYLKNHLDKGLSYSASINQALIDLGLDKSDVNEFSKPNNTLAIGYIKAIKNLGLNINLHTIKRIDNNYYDDNIYINSNLASANQIRNLLRNKEDITKYIPNDIYKKVDFNGFIDEETGKKRMLELLKYNFLIHSNKDILDSFYKSIHLVNEGIENRIYSFINKCNSYDELIKNVQTKRYNINRINRILINILLEKRNDYTNDEEIITYLRILGMNEKGKTLLSKLDKETKKIIISNINKLDDMPKILDFELKSSRLYDILTDNNTYELEFKTPIKMDTLGDKNA